MILCIGEILADMIGSCHNGAFCYERKAGGAPFNVACEIKKFGGKAAFVGNVGNDIIGRYLLRFAKERDLDKCLITVDEHHNTTLAFVELDESGERSFCFYRKDTADFHIPDVPDELLQQADIVCVGSLMLSEDIGRKYANRIIAKAKSIGKIIAFDINYRSDIFRDEKDAVERYKEIIKQVDIVKFSEDEADIFTEEYISELTDKLVCVSLGGEGSRWHYHGEVNIVPTILVKTIDTTGAGDAFYAGVLTKLSSKPRNEWTTDFLNSALRFGNVCGALNTQGKGAIDCLPELGEIESRL